MICDNGTQFTSAEFQDLSTRYGFRVVTSSPYYPKEHGFIERQVQTVKKILIKCKEAGTDSSLALLSLRSTPLSATLRSPSELLNGRTFKTKLPVKILPPIAQQETRELLLTQQEKQVNLYNHNSKQIPNLFQDQAVQVQDPEKKTWNPARIVGCGPTPRSYITEDEFGTQLRRNRQLIKSDIQKTTYDHVVRNDGNNGNQSTSPSVVDAKKNTEGHDMTAFKTRSGRIIKKPD